MAYLPHRSIGGAWGDRPRTRYWYRKVQHQIRYALDSPYAPTEQSIWGTKQLRALGYIMAKNPDDKAEPYNPLVDTPRLWEELAKIGHTCVALGGTIEVDIEELARFPRRLPLWWWIFLTRSGRRVIVGLGARNSPAIKLPLSPGLQVLPRWLWEPPAKLPDQLIEQILQFCYDFGLPRLRTKIADGRVVDFMPTVEFIWCAIVLYETAALAAAVDRAKGGSYSDLQAELARRFPGYPADEELTRRGQDPRIFHLERGTAQLADWFNWAGDLNGIRPWLDVSLAPPRPRLVPAYDWGWLLQAIWLQLYQAAVGGRVGPHCKKCGIMFETKDWRQIYCSESCRHSAAQAAYRARQRERKESNSGEAGKQ